MYYCLCAATYSAIQTYTESHCSLKSEQQQFITKHDVHLICDDISFIHIVWVLMLSKVGFTHIAVNFKFHSWFANFKLTSSLECVWTTRGFVT